MNVQWNWPMITRRTDQREWREPDQWERRELTDENERRRGKLAYVNDKPARRAEADQWKSDELPVSNKKSWPIRTKRYVSNERGGRGVGGGQSYSHVFQLPRFPSVVEIMKRRQPPLPPPPPPTLLWKWSNRNQHSCPKTERAWVAALTRSEPVFVNV